MPFYDPIDRRYKSVRGAIAQNTEVTFTVLDCDGAECTFCLLRDGESEERKLSMNKVDNGFSVSVSLPETGLYFYWFSLDGNNFECGENRLAECGEKTEKYRLTVFSADFRVPDFISGGAIYQIFPDRFYRSGQLPESSGRKLHSDWFGVPEFLPDAEGVVRNDDFFGGNLKGIEEKLDYIASLGVTTIYLNPIFEAASNHRYDTGDYMSVDRLLGDKSTLQSLFRAADERGIKVILDGVFNHTGADSLYFNKFGNYPTVGAYQSQSSPYYNWYSFSDFPDKYGCWWGIDTLPQTNEDDSGFREYICGINGVLRDYLRLGAFGYRLDVADELPSDFVKLIRAAIKAENTNALCLGEVWEDASDKISYGVRREYLQGGELDSVMNYPLKDSIINFVLTHNSYELSQTVRSQLDNYPRAVLDALMNMLGTHDTPRILTVLSGAPFPEHKSEMLRPLTAYEREQGKKSLKTAIILQFTLYGVPSVYYGDEAGLEGYSDPFNRMCYPWGREDGELVELFRTLGRLRRRPVFDRGEFEIVYERKNVFAYRRDKDGASVFVVVNYSLTPYVVEFSETMTDYHGGVSAKRFEVGVDCSTIFCSCNVFK